MIGVLAVAALTLVATGTDDQPSNPRPLTRAVLQSELEAAREEIARQRRQIDDQEARLHALEERLTGTATNQPSALHESATRPPLAALAQGSAASTPGDPATIQQAPLQVPLENVGQRPRDRNRPPEVAILGSEGSVVTTRGQLTGELQLDYAHADRNTALFRGIEVVESVLVGEFNINQSRQDILTASLAVRYGLTNKLEFGVRVPFVHRADDSVLVPVQGSTNNDNARQIDSAATGTGIGDIELSARYQLVAAHGGFPFLVGNLQVVAPTGTDPFAVPRLDTGEATKAATGAGFWGVSPSITAILPSDPAVLFGTIGYTRNFGKSVNTMIPPVRLTYVKPGDALSFSAGIGLALNDRTSLNLGYAQTWVFGTRTRAVLIDPGPADPTTPTESTSRDLQLGRFLFGVSYRVNNNASVNWSVEVGATQDAPDVRTVLRLPLLLLSPKQ